MSEAAVQLDYAQETAHAYRRIGDHWQCVRCGAEADRFGHPIIEVFAAV